jgi:hypothetical protein
VCCNVVANPSNSFPARFVTSLYLSHSPHPPVFDYNFLQMDVRFYTSRIRRNPVRSVIIAKAATTAGQQVMSNNSFPVFSNMKTSHKVATMKKSLSLSLVLAVALGLSACTVVPAHGQYYGPTVTVWAPIAPPPPRVEVIPPPPRHDHFWAPGYWHWENNQHRWIGGHWEQHREHERWVPHQWERNDHGQWEQHGGHWRRD